MNGNGKKRRFRCVTPVLAVLFSNLMLASNVSADMITLLPSKDNTLIQTTNPAAQLSNGLGDIFVGRTNQDGQGPATISIRRGLLAFDIAGNIPSGATITSVSLILRDVMGLNGDHIVGLHRVLQDWGEGTSFQNGGMGATATNGDATWLYRFYNSANPGSSLAWTTAGGDFDPTASAGALISDDLGGGQLFTWSSTGNPQFLTEVQNMLDDPSSNFGWLLLGDELAGQTAKRLNGGESLAFPNQPPVLVIEFTVAAVPEPSTWLLLTSVAVAVGLVRAKRRTA